MKVETIVNEDNGGNGGMQKVFHKQVISSTNSHHLS